MKKNNKYNIKNDNTQDLDNLGFSRRALIKNLPAKPFFLHGSLFACSTCLRHALLALLALLVSFSISL